MTNLRLRLILIYGVICVTSSSFIIRLAEQKPYSLAFTRVLLTGLIASIILRKFSLTDYKMDFRDKVKIFIAGFALATHFGWWFESLDYLPIGTSLSLTNTAPVWLAFLLYFAYDEKINRRQWMAISLVIIGCIILFLDNKNLGDTGLLGLTLALGSAIGFAIYLVMARNMVSKIGLWQYFGMVNLCAAFVFVPWIIFNSQIYYVFTVEIWFWGVILALVPGISGHAVYNWAMSKINPIEVGLVTLAEPILGLILAWFIFAEVLSFYQIIGISILLSAILISINSKSQ
ncbi:MAG: DMT family transporter [Candidatus Heimdallarchaeota archaeon]|nr:DMT family transporter [Candidatus Heimdallarchaeota archaeon]MDH5645008.1 DMT family transporter [Candidatus Heimdallarchaeota archaeon]